MKRAILLSGLLVLVLSCNSNRIKELETENVELKTSMELCRQEAEQQRALAQVAEMWAIAAQAIAEEQAQKSRETAEQAKK